MSSKPTYEELEQRVKKLEKETIEFRRGEDALRESVKLLQHSQLMAYAGSYRINLRTNQGRYRNLTSPENLICNSWRFKI